MDAERTGALITDPTANFDDRLRAAGLRSTRQRVAVLTAFQGHDGHHRADEIVGFLVDLGTPLPRSTVFKVLDDLVRVGLVQRADLGSGAARYERADIAPHQHFVCRICGSIDDVPHAVDPIRDLELAASDLGHEVDAVEVIARGRCRTCRGRGIDAAPVDQTDD